MRLFNEAGLRLEVAKRPTVCVRDWDRSGLFSLVNVGSGVLRVRFDGDLVRVLVPVFPAARAMRLPGPGVFAPGL